MRIIIYLSIGFFGLIACSKNPGTNFQTQYFEVGQLSANEWEDSIDNAIFSERLKNFQELPLKKIDGQVFRLTVYSPHYNTYCIRVERNQEARVSFKIRRDSAELSRSGTNGVELNYSSKHSKIDSMFSSTMQSLKTFVHERPVNMTPAGGDTYLIESNFDGKHNVLVLWSGDEDVSIKEKIDAFVPACLLVDMKTATKLEDLLFPVLK